VYPKPYSALVGWRKHGIEVCRLTYSPMPFMRAAWWKKEEEMALRTGSHVRPHVVKGWE
jgi:hypothetical protein